MVNGLNNVRINVFRELISSRNGRLYGVEESDVSFPAINCQLKLKLS